jgi:DNA-binding NtrC family response regulator
MATQQVLHPFIGASPSAEALRTLIARVASSTATALITGESGTGKELVARALHDQSDRSQANFVPINCAAIPTGLVESELFGHRKGSFTGAMTDRIGRFELANGGTIFLDEIGDLSLDMQVKLLRVLQERSVDPVGGTKSVPVDVRVVAATHRDLEQEIVAGRFREDLYYRLNTVPIRVPALRDRQEDILLLFRKFATDFGEKYKTPPVQLTDEAKQVLIQYTWPGNVRELKNVAEQISVLSKEKIITGEQLQSFLPEHQYSKFPALSGGPGVVTQTEFANEREILYKLFFDMKKDVNELKKMFFELIQNPGMAAHVPVYQQESAIINPIKEINANASGNYGTTGPAVILRNDQHAPIQQHEDVEESLSIIDKEKELIIKALKKHRSKRRDAALDLGISERTLYRKLKEYDIEHL